MQSWLQLTYHLTLDKLEQMETQLQLVKADAITIQDGENQPIFEPEPGTTPYWETMMIKALFTLHADVDPSELGNQLDTLIRSDQALLALPKPEMSVIDDEQWQKRCIKDFQPMPFGERLWIVPSWSEKPTNAAVSVFLDPGIAFGTGSHPTTSLCLKWLDEHISEPIHVIDYGCGSGILALSAIALGAQSALAIDIDPQAVTACRENVVKNQMADKIQCITVDQSNEQTQADCIMANILAKPLISLVDSFADMLKPKAKVVLSGILSNQIDIIITAFSSRFEHFRTQEEAGWGLVEAVKKD